MDVTQLAFNTETMLAGLRRWVESESPTYDAAAVSRMVGVAAADLWDMGALVEPLPAPPGLGACARAAFPHPRAGEPGILIMAHLDTVHPIGTLGRLPFRLDGGRCYGPGILDMKGGGFIALQAVHALANAGAATPLPVHVLLTCDEEIGSPGTRELILAEASRHKNVLVPEPASQGHGVTTGRYAIARFKLTATGRASHAGARLKDGRSAIREMAKQILAIEAMTGEDCTFSVGVVHGGQWVNCVATECRAEVLSMAKRQSDLDAGIERMLALSHGDADGVGFQVELSVVRPVWEADAATMRLYETARTVAASLGLDLPHGSSGGGSDGNFTGAAGIPTLDGLGLRGSGYHTLNEHIEVASLAERGRLMAGLLLALE
ncbi:MULTISPECIES: M20/M25/M40 family metallo-hydrolase [Rhodomicrobium]|uniref:M20/M25/M40 family metallo-hydrolase n=1 Tax=Rhodomicrobium TaxID=1068 RepID=UPI000B4AD897|nr:MULTISPECIES: M20/M25/M40 family metallo-hydrolase [Rhodomicrobium]